MTDARTKAIEAIRQGLAEAHWRPDAIRDALATLESAAPAEGVAEGTEPVAWRTRPYDYGEWAFTAEARIANHRRDHEWQVESLYAAPPPPAPAPESDAGQETDDAGNDRPGLPSPADADPDGRETPITRRSEVDRPAAADLPAPEPGGYAGLRERLKEGADRIANRAMGDTTRAPLISIPVSTNDIDVIMTDAATAIEALEARVRELEGERKPDPLEANRRRVTRLKTENEHVMRAGAVWETNETPPRRLTVKGRSGIDPDVLVAHLDGDTAPLWIVDDGVGKADAHVCGIGENVRASPLKTKEASDAE